MLQKFKILRTKEFTPNADILAKLNEELFQIHYLKAGYEFANYTLNSVNIENVPARQFANAILVDHFVFLKRNDSLSKYISQLESLLQPDSSPILMNSYFNGKAIKASEEGKMFESVVNFKQALAVTPEEDRLSRQVLHFNIAGTYSDYGFYDKAKYHADLAIKEHGYDSVPNNLNTLGIIESILKNFKRADEIFTRAIKFGEENGRPDVLAPSYANYGNLKRKEKKFEEALIYIGKSDSISEVYGVEVGFLINGVNRAEVFHDQGRYSDALKELQAAYKRLIEFDIPQYNSAYYDLLSKVYSGLGETALADRYFRKYIENKEEYKDDFSRGAVSEWELATERELNQKQLDAFRITSERERATFYLVAFILTVLLLFFAITYFYLSRKRIIESERHALEKLKLQQDLESKSKELLTDSLNSINVRNTKDEIRNELEVILNQLPEKVRKQFSSLNFKLKVGKEANFLDEFKMRFSGIYDSFYKSIIVLAPDLTPNELRVCAFIRLNITSKDIARLTGKSLGTIESARAKIRKKLNMNSDDNLQQFLLKL